MDGDLVTSPTTLSGLPSTVRHGLTAVSVLASMSLASSSALFLILLYRIVTQLFRAESRKARHTNQFIWLIFNLVLADIQQACAFIINAHWLSQDEITVGTSACWAQGWFVSTGDLASGVWCFTIGLHTFASVIFKYRLSMPWFYCWIVLLWVFIYGLALIGVAMHDDLYVRAGAWCWVNLEYPSLRLFAHYLWIFIAEFGNVVIYSLIFVTLRLRLKQNYFQTPEAAAHARTAVKVMVVYPAVYVVCTLPLAALRMASEHLHPSLEWFCAAGAMITSNGWLDVLIYTLTRRIPAFNEPEEELLDTFSFAWERGAGFGQFGTTTTIVAGKTDLGNSAHEGDGTVGRDSSTLARAYMSVFNGGLGHQRSVRKPQPLDSTEELVQLPPGAQDGVRTHRTVTVTVGPMSPEDRAVVGTIRQPPMELDSLDGDSMRSKDWKDQRG